MAGFQGADTAQLRTLAQKMQVQSGRLEELRSRIDPLVRNEGSWTGPDAESFRASWAQTGPSMAHATQSLTGRAKDLIRQADEQDKASEVSATHGPSCAPGEGSGGDGGHHGKSLWDRAGDAFNHVKSIVKPYVTAQSLFSAAKKAWDITHLVKNGRAVLKFADSLDDPLMSLMARSMYGQELLKKTFSGGKEFSALAQSIVGKIGLPNGFGPKSFFSWADKAVAEKAPYLLKGAKFLGPVLSAVDMGWSGYKAIEAYQNGDTFHTVTKGLQSFGAGVMLAGGAMAATGIGAPFGGVVIAVGAGINLGALAVESIHDYWPQISGAASKAWDWAGDRAGDVKDAVDHVKDTVADGVDHAKSAISDGANKMKDGVTSLGKKLHLGW